MYPTTYCSASVMTSRTVCDPSYGKILIDTSHD